MSEWRKIWSASKKAFYFYHPVTRESRWTLPEEEGVQGGGGGLLPTPGGHRDDWGGQDDRARYRDRGRRDDWGRHDGGGRQGDRARYDDRGRHDDRGCRDDRRNYHAGPSYQERRGWEERRKRPLDTDSDHEHTHRHKHARPNLNFVLPPFEDVSQQRHLLQVTGRQSANYTSHTDLEFSRRMGDDFPRLAYRRRKGEVKSVIHWGQRKLLMSEIEFLTLHGQDGDLVVYAGAAPGTHTAFLAELFPKMDFVLVDPAPFSPKLKEGPHMILRQELFTDDLAREYAGRTALFVCDIRSTDWDLDSDAHVETQVGDDMTAQMRWHNIIKPRKSMLKFRLSWNPGSTEYLNGEVYLPVWGPITTTEARLITTEGVREYDNKAYEEQMFYFNTTYRVARFRHDTPGEGLDFCYDCRAEVHILKQYLEHKGLPATAEDVAMLSYRTSRECGSKDRTLLSPNSDPEERKQGIRSKQWVQGAPAYRPQQQPEPQYSGFAKKAMQQMGDASRLGKVVEASSQVGRRGLGFQPGSYFPGTDPANHNVPGAQEGSKSQEGSGSETAAAEEAVGLASQEGSAEQEPSAVEESAVRSEDDAGKAPTGEQGEQQ